MTTLIRNLEILTLDAEGRRLECADLVVEGGRITHLGEAPATLRADEVIDGTGRVALPGLFNSHCHASMTFERGVAEDMAFPEWLPAVWKIENVLSADDVYWGAALATIEMIKTGCVGFNDMYFHMDRVADAVRESGMKAALGETVFDPGEGSAVGDALGKALTWDADMAAESHPRLRVYLAPHSPYTCSQPLLEEVVAAAHDTGRGIHTHLSEDQRQVDQSLERYGMTPVQHLESIGAFEVPGGLVAAHTLVVDERDLEILEERRVRVPHCPITYAKLAMPMFSLAPFFERGVTVGLATDGPASNADMDLFAVMRQTALLQKYLSLDPGAVPGDTLLRMATSVGAEIAGFPESGRLEVGAPADLILVRTDVAHMTPRHDLVANLVHSAKGADVTDTMVDGQWLMRNRELVTLDEEKVVAEAQARAEALVERAR
ncbi:MAG: amidohydrolase [Acidobacteriota bacterium]